MSIAYNRKKKERRRVRDELNPERIRIRRMIRSGVIPRFYIAELNGKKLYKTGRYWVGGKAKKLLRLVSWPLLRSSFKMLTEEKAKG